MVDKEKNLENALQDESFAKFVLQDNSKSNKRKDIIFLIVIILLIGFCIYKEVSLNELLQGATFSQSESYDVDGGNGNAILNGSGEVNVNGKDKSENTQNN